MNKKSLPPRPRRPFALLVLLIATVLAAWGASASVPAEPDTTWMALMLEGEKTGWMKSVRRVVGDRIIHEETVHIAVQRSGVPIEMTTMDRSVESPDGRPLAFTSRMEIAGGTMEIEGFVAGDGTTTVRTVSDGSVQHQTFPWPEGALLHEGIRLETLRYGLEPGTRIEVTSFVPSSLQAAPVEIVAHGVETVDLFGVEIELTRTEHTMQLGATETRIMAWMDEELRTRKARFNIIGLTLETIACPEECALAETQPAEFFTQAFAASPRDLGAPVDADHLVYTIRANGEEAIHFPESSEQRVERRPDGALIVRVAAQAAPEPVQSFIASEWLGQTRWLQTGAPELIALLATAGGGGDDPRAVMQRLERFVRGYVSQKNLSVGYASALETARSRSGDCTEHALLLAALGRAAGIPTRIATGLAYVDDWLGADDVFIPHAWTQALIDGRWVSFDAALFGFDAGHLALSYGDGDPWNFYDGVNTLGNFEIVAIEVGP